MGVEKTGPNSAQLFIYGSQGEYSHGKQRKEGVFDEKDVRSELTGDGRCTLR